jgi:hypothetical protein
MHAARRARWLIGALLLLACSACREDSSLTDLRFSAISAVDRYDLTELSPSSVAHIGFLIGDKALAESGLLANATSAHRPMLKAEFTSAADLAEFAGLHRVENVANFGYLCAQPTDYVVLMYPGVYTQGHRVTANRLASRSDSHAETAPRLKYYVFMEVARKESPDSRPPQVGFDFRVKAADVCFYLSGGNEIAGRTFKSNVVKIPAEAIAASLHKTP